MHNPFSWTDTEKSSVTGSQQLDMLNRLVDFVNARLSEIEDLQDDMGAVKSDIEDIKNPTK